MNKTQNWRLKALWVWRTGDEGLSNFFLFSLSRDFHLKIQFEFNFKSNLFKNVYY